jgi:predicted DNA-binding transcriptional regulator AlpA
LLALLDGQIAMDAKKRRKTAPAKPVTDDEYLRTPAAAHYVKLSEEYLEAARCRRDGTGPNYIKLVRAVIYRKSDLDAWMAANVHAADQPI